MNSPTLHLDLSNAWRGLYFECDGQPVPLEDAFKEGFTVSREDAPAVLTLLQNWIQTRDECQK